jgi:hypothetical protein
MSSRFVMLALAASLFAPVTAAGEADICYSANVPLGTSAPPTNATVFACPTAGNLTLPQLAAAGWRVVQLTPVVTSGSTQANQLVIQRP